MRRRDLIKGIFVGAPPGWPFFARAQQPDPVRTLWLQILEMQANGLADRIGQFIREIESQVGWTTQLPWSDSTLAQRRFDALRLLRQVPAITTVFQLDALGREQLRISRVLADSSSGTPYCLLEVPPPTHQEVGGSIGIGLIMRDGLIRVVTPLPGTPAAKAGILANDIITKVDGEPVQGLTLDQAVEKMRGLAGTKITLTIVRVGEDKSIDLTITREPIKTGDVPPPPAADLSKCQPEFGVAMTKHVYYGPVDIRPGSEPHMTLSLAGTRRATGVSVVDVNLKYIWDLVSRMKVGERGVAYVVDADGKLIAHPDLSLVLGKTDLSGLAQVRAALAAGSGAAREPAMPAQDIQGREVLAAFAPVARVGWSALVEVPADEVSAR